MGTSTGSSGGVVNETWEWNGTDWFRPTLTTSPPARFYNGMVFDAARGVHVLFGGYGSARLDDTWQ